MDVYRSSRLHWWWIEGNQVLVESLVQMETLAGGLFFAGVDQGNYGIVKIWRSLKHRWNGLMYACTKLLSTNSEPLTILVSIFESDRTLLITNHHYHKDARCWLRKPLQVLKPLHCPFWAGIGTDIMLASLVFTN